MTTIHEIAESLRQSGELGERSLAALDRFIAASNDFAAKLAEAYASIPTPTNPKE